MSHRWQATNGEGSCAGRSKMPVSPAQDKALTLVLTAINFSGSGPERPRIPTAGTLLNPRCRLLRITPYNPSFLWFCLYIYTGKSLGKAGIAEISSVVGKTGFAVQESGRFWHKGGQAVQQKGTEPRGLGQTRAKASCKRTVGLSGRAVRLLNSDSPPFGYLTLGRRGATQCGGHFPSKGDPTRAATSAATTLRRGRIRTLATRHSLPSCEAT